MPATNRSGYSHTWLIAILFIMAADSLIALLRVAHHHYPLGLETILLLLPCLRREIDLKNGRSLRPFGSFEWSCIGAGALWLLALPILLS